MAVENLVGPPHKLAKFASLVVALLMTGATVTNILYGHYWLSLATAIIGAWAILTFTEVLIAEIAPATRAGNAPSDERPD